MDKINHQGLISGLSDEEQLDLAVKAAQKITSSATMQLNEEVKKNAKQAVSDAIVQYEKVKSSREEHNEQLLNEQLKKINECQHQLNTSFK
ncbi:DUF2564 family protein [Bacillus carboniphilus]|uniref:DUF2564 family protein n=1 Tax=Bacillus carboniphilus TaxID=86663 RepID=A0ABY9JZC0_9BACI|nr:DUF2564 family protein [Bacillus carboniphilus]WLR43683.1 DUF2564 family protein [Bacillus carboniphilus]